MHTSKRGYTMIDQLLSYNLLPDFVIRTGIKHLLKQRLDELATYPKDATLQFKQQIENAPIALNTQDANDQHYEVPEKFYGLVLGKHRKYSCGYWVEGDNLDSSEERMLELTTQRAELKDHQKILELGCGWGSLSLYVASKYPNSQITGVSNSHSQKQYILGQAKERGLKNLNIITCDMNDFSTTEKYDRVVSVEMFEHMRNWEKLLSKVDSFLDTEGKLFIHIFVHHKTPYLFEVKDQSDWMSKYFFTGGMMPSFDLLDHYKNHFDMANKWVVNGQHYAKTALAWLHNIDHHEEEVLDIFTKHYGSEKNAKKWMQYWRIFFMACEELWNFKDGNEWYVAHYLLNKRK